MRVDTRPRHRNTPRIAEKSAPAFLQFIRGRDCTFAHLGGCEGKIEAMHLDFAGGKGTSTKVADKHAIPGCAAHHRLQHRVGWGTFAEYMRTSKGELLRAAETFWRAWPGRVAWERKLSDG